MTAPGEPDDTRRRIDEETWFAGGAPVPDDYVDPDLARDEGASWAHRAVLYLVAAFALFLGTQYTRELAYFFTPHEPLDLNAGADEPTRIGAAYFDAHGQLTLPAHRFARVSGVPQRRSVAADREYFALVGAPLFVERRVIDDRPRVLRDQPRSIPRGQESVRPVYQGSGRVVPFDALPARYEAFVRFYSDAYRTEYCGFAPSPALRAHQTHLRREAELALIDALGRPPSEAEVIARAGPTIVCQRGYLLLDGETPSGAWMFLAAYMVFCLVAVGAAYYLWRTRRAAA